MMYFSVVVVVVVGLNVVGAAVLCSTTTHWMKVFTLNLSTKGKIGWKNIKISFPMVRAFKTFSALKTERKKNRSIIHSNH